MGYAIFSARKIMLNARINTLNLQLMCLNESQMNLHNQMSNYQRGMSISDQYSKLGNMLAQHYGLNNLFSTCGQKGDYISPILSNDDWLQNFDKYAILSLMETDIEAQKQQISTQLKAAEAEMKELEEGEKNAIQRATPKYA